MNRDRLTPRQRSALCWAALLPAVTAETAALAGRGGLLGALLAAGVPALLYRWRPRPGRAAELAGGLWALAAGGILLRLGAHRLSAAVYPEAAEGLFFWGLLLCAAVLASGSRRALGRLGALTAPVLGATLALVLALAAPMLDPRELWPLRAGDGAELLPALGRTLGAAALGLTLFPPEGEERPSFPGAALTGLTAALLSLAVTGALGAAAAREMGAPLFVLIRNLRPGHLPERLEPLAAGMWVITDLLALAAAMQRAGRTLFPGDFGPDGAKSVRGPAVCAAALAAGGLLWGRGFFTAEIAAEWILPAGSLLAAAAALLPGKGGRKQTV